MQSALIFLVKTLADLYLLTFLLRFLMQWARASHYNPLSQFVFKVTNPLVVPARRVLPSMAGVDAPTLVVLIVLEIVVTFVLLLLAGLTLPIPQLLVYSLLRLVLYRCTLYICCLELVRRPRRQSNDGAARATRRAGAASRAPAAASDRRSRLIAADRDPVVAGDHDRAAVSAAALVPSLDSVHARA
jgi:uncharacterized protein YggT (Ycf19 family)